MRRWTLVSAAGAACTVACGLGTAGVGPPDWEGGASSGSGSGSGASIDGGGDVAGSSGSSGGSASGSGSGSSSGSASGSGSGGASEGGAPTCVSGWTLVLGEVGNAAACPSGYPDAYHGVANPQAQAGACTCSCDITTQPNCTVGNLTWNYGSQAPACPGASPMYSNGACNLVFGMPMLGTAQQVQPLPFSGGACSGQAVGDTMKVQQTTAQTCSVPDANEATVCSGTVPSGFAACVIAPGDVPCPSGSPFSNRTVLADSETLVCSACSACSVTGTCQNPQLVVYGDGACTSAIATIPANGTCVNVNPQGSGKVGGYSYKAQAQAQCSASGTSASFQPKNPQTLCCR